MNLKALQAFAEVVRQGGFSKAAKTVFATQSTVSKAVKSLEDELGVRLFERLGQGSVLTAAGEIVYRRVLTILAEKDDMLAQLDELQGMKRGHLSLGLPPIGSSTLFAPVFASYHSRYPGVAIRFVEHGSKRLEELVLAGELEIGASLLPLGEGFDTQEIRKEPIAALLPHDHPLARRENISMAELRDMDFILFGTEFALDPIILDACRTIGFSPNVVVTSSQIDFMVELVAAGLGVGFLPRMIAEERYSRTVACVEIATPALYWHMALIWRKGGYLSHAATAWLQLCAEHLPPGQ